MLEYMKNCVFTSMCVVCLMGNNNVILVKYVGGTFRNNSSVTSQADGKYCFGAVLLYLLSDWSIFYISAFISHISNINRMYFYIKIETAF